MKEILKIIYIAVCLAVCLYPIYRWIEDAVYEIGSYFKRIHHSDSCSKFMMMQTVEKRYIV